MSDPWTKEHLSCLNYIENKETADGKEVEIYEFNHNIFDNQILSKWAKHFRNQYCLDSLIDLYRDGTGYSRTEYLNNLKFPERNVAGAKTRSGDFGEILVSDFLEYNLGYWVPRTRFSDRHNRNNPTQGVDVIGFKSRDYTQNDRTDQLFIFEVKCKLTGTNENLTKSRMDTAIKDSAKDFNVRKGESLNGLKQLFISQRNMEYAKRIKRFQEESDRPYIEMSGATSIILSQAYNSDKIIDIDASNHPNYDRLKLIIIKGESLMPLVHALYEKAANEA